MTAAVPRLHLPDEPTSRRPAWRDAVLGGAPLGDVVGGGDGVAGWLWERWSALAGAGVGRDAFGAVATGYGREIWLWLVGDRTWSQTCAGLIGRVARRFPAEA
ncbi:MAG: hypothetical protein ACRDY3_14005 [Acidimicrobiales bacterium]